MGFCVLSTKYVKTAYGRSSRIRNLGDMMREFIKRYDRVMKQVWETGASMSFARHFCTHTVIMIFFFMGWLTGLVDGASKDNASNAFHFMIPIIVLSPIPIILCLMVQEWTMNLNRPMTSRYKN
jgi:hypothetical protein